MQVRDVAIEKSVLLQQIVECGIDMDTAAAILPVVNQSLMSLTAAECWQKLTKDVLKPDYPFSLHELLYNKTFSNWDRSQGPPPAWFPSREEIQSTHIWALMQELNLSSYTELHAWSTTHRAEFWHRMIQLVGIQFQQAYSQVMDLSNGAVVPEWLLGARFNIVESCFQAPADAPAIVSQLEGGSSQP